MTNVVLHLVDEPDPEKTTVLAHIDDDDLTPLVKSDGDVNLFENFPY